MATYTQDQFIDRVLSYLGVTGEEQTGSAGQRQIVSDTLAAAYEQLDAERVISPIAGVEIEARVFLPLVRLVANECAPDFGIPRTEEARLMAMMDLRRVTAGAFINNTPLTADYF